MHESDMKKEMERYFDIYDEYLELNSKTSLAVAVKYNKEDNAPVVVAKGKDLMAKRIVEIAKENGIETVYNESAANDLMQVDIGFEIPCSLYKAVSVILAYVYSLENSK